MRNFKTNYDRNHYYYNRTDPWKDVPFEEEKKSPESSIWYMGVMCLAIAVILSYVLGYISAP